MSQRAECPRCGSTVLRRARRQGLLERLLSLTYVYPFVCVHCFHRFLSLRWGTRYRRRVIA